MPAATSTDYGNSLQSVRTLQKKNNALQTEIDGHQPRIDEVCERGQAMIEENHPRSPEIDEGLRNMNDQLEKLKDAVKDRDDRLKESEKAQKVSSFIISSKKCNIFFSSTWCSINLFPYDMRRLLKLIIGFKKMHMTISLGTDGWGGRRGDGCGMPFPSILGWVKMVTCLSLWFSPLYLVLLWRSRGRGLAERARVVHDGRGEG